MEQKTARISIIGKSNTGKSTLLNYILGEKLVIVTPKVQTTRNIINGIINIENTQLIFCDTPGIFNPKNKLDKFMVRSAWSSIAGCDCIILLLDATKPIDEDFCQKVMNATDKNKLIVTINKIDLSDTKSILSLKEKILSLNSKLEIFEISAFKGENIDLLLNFLIENAPCLPWTYRNNEITTAPMRFIAEEITREKLFLLLKQELPYNLKVETEKWTEDNSLITIQQKIVVSRKSHKNIVVGSGGKNVKDIGQKSRIELSDLFGKPVNLFIFVQVREKWLDSDYIMQSMNNFI